MPEWLDNAITIIEFIGLILLGMLPAVPTRSFDVLLRKLRAMSPARTMSMTVMVIQVTVSR